MANYTIEFTDGSSLIPLAPGQVNGVGGGVHSTDLSFYGMGVLSWGEGVNQNFLKLLENFASPEGLPGEPDPAYFSDSPAHIKGQLWFNTTSGTLLVYTGSLWKRLGGVGSGVTPPSSPQEGDLWYDTVAEQLKIFDGLNWVSVSENYLPLTGGSMAGDLTIPGNNQLLFDNLFLNEGNGDATIAPDIRANGSMLQTAAVDFLVNVDDSNLGTGVFKVSKGTQVIGGSTTLFEIENNGRIISQTPSYETLITTDNTLTNKKYIDVAITNLASSSGTLYLPKTGGTMSGVINMGSNKITSMANPTVGSDAANKTYVDATFLPVAGTAVNSTKWGNGTKTISSSAPSGGSDGDVWFKY